MYRPLVEIKKPCHEALEKRKPGEAGSYCKSCQITVIDFTKKTPEEITAYFIEQGQKKSCGIFNRNDVILGHTDRILSFFSAGRLRFITLFMMSLLLLTGCRTRKTRTVTYGSGRFLDKNNASIEHLK